MEQIVGGRKPGLVANAIPTDIEHLKRAVGIENDRVVNAALIKIAFSMGGREHELGEFIRSAKRGWFVCSCHRQVRPNGAAAPTRAELRRKRRRVLFMKKFEGLFEAGTLAETRLLKKES